jgi:hypothetical protein
VPGVETPTRELRQGRSLASFAALEGQDGVEGQEGEMRAIWIHRSLGR